MKADGLCYKNDFGCSFYRAGTCYACQNPYVLENGQCKIDGCSNYATGGSCSACNSPYKLASGFCKIDNCQKSSNGICKTCESGFHIHNGSCLKPL